MFHLYDLIECKVQDVREKTLTISERKGNGNEKNAVLIAYCSYAGFYDCMFRV